MAEVRALPLTPALVGVAPPHAPAALPAPPPGTQPPRPAPAAPAEPAQSEAASAAGERVLAATLTRDAALRLAAGRLLHVERSALELVPFHVYRYACRLEAPGAIPVPKSGLLGVDAVTGAVRTMEEPRFAPPHDPAQRLEPLLGEAEAAAPARRTVVETHTQKMRVRANLGRSALIVEDRMVRPDPRTMTLEPQGTWWLPVWRCEGPNGSVRVDAHAGRIEEERLKKNFAADAEFL